MRKLLMTLSFASLALVVAAPVLFYTQAVSLEMNKFLLNIATAVWFVSALCWMGRESCNS